MSLYDVVSAADDKLSALRDEFTRLSREERKPMYALLELSPLCNFTCPFCYARVSPEQMKKNGEHVMRFDEWKRIIDGLCELNVMTVALSGGECMLHPDFQKIYRYAYGKGLCVSLLTNCSALTPEIAEMLKECPPEKISITMYGASPETYERVCGNAAYYDKVVRNIRLIDELDFDYSLAFTANCDNLDDLEAISDFADSLGVPFAHTIDFIKYRRCGDEIIAENAPDRTKYDEIVKRIDSKKGVGNFVDKLSEDYLDSFVVGKKKDEGEEKKGIRCSAGRSLCAINYKGEMQPCITFDAISVDPNGRSISDCWNEIVKQCDEVAVLRECRTCLFRLKCRMCISQHYNDTKQFGVPSPRLCYKRLYPEKAKMLEQKYNETGDLRVILYDR